MSFAERLSKAESYVEYRKNIFANASYSMWKKIDQWCV